MSDTEVGVRITGNATGAVEAFNVSEEAAARALTVMVEHFKRLGVISTEEMAKTGVATKLAAAETAESATIAQGALARWTLATKEHVEATRAHFERFSGIFTHLNAVIIGTMAALAGGEAFEKAIEKSNELASANLNLSKRFGITLAEASGLHAALNKFGIDTETVTGAVQKMDRQLKSHESALVDMGVQTRDANGHLRNQLDIFMSGLDALRQYKEGTDRNLAAQAMFGRGVGDVAQLLRLNRQELEEGAESARKLGLVTDAEGVASMKRYKIAIAETKEVFEAIMVAIGQRVLPILTRFAEYIRDNGESIMAGFGKTLDAVGAVFGVLGAVISAVNDDVLVPLRDIIIEVAAVMRQGFVSATEFVGRHLDDLAAIARTVAGVLVTGLAAAFGYYATIVTVSAIPATITFARTLFTSVLPALYASTRALIAGLIPALGALAEALALNIFRMIALDAVNPVVWVGVAVGVVAALAAGFAAWLGWLDPIIDKMKDLWGWTQKFLGLDKAFKAFKEGGVGGNHDDENKALLLESYQNGLGGAGHKRFTGAPKKEKKEKADPSRMPEFDAQLAERKLSLDKLNNAENTFREMSKAEEASYWQEILARSDLSVKERAAAEAKYLAASLAAKKQSFDAMIAQQQAEIVADKGHCDARLAMAKKIVAEMTAAYGAGSKQVAEAEKGVTRVIQEEATKQAKAADEAAQWREKAELGIVDATEVAAKHRVAMGQETAAQLIVQERKFENDRYAILKEAIAARIAAAALDPTTSPEKVRQLNAQIEIEERKHQTALTKIANDGAMRRTQTARGAIDEVGSAWGMALAKMVTLQASLGETLKSLWQGLVGAITNALAGMLAQYLVQWLTTLIIGKGAQAAAGVGGVASNAAVAGSAAYASTAAIPIIGPELAPMAADAAYFGALSFGSLLPSFATGAWDLPNDMIAQVHKGEMIVPRTFADDFRSNGGPGATGGSGGGGDTHNWTVVLNDTAGAEQFFLKNKAGLAKALASAYRDGVRR